MAENLNTYQGNAALGQGTAGVAADIGPIGPIDFKNLNDAVDKTTYYQVLEKRDKWARNNLVLDKMAQDAAAGTKFSLGEISPLNRDRITAMIKDLNEFFTDHPTSFTLDPLGTNAKEVAQMQQMTTAINSAISNAQKQRQQELGLIDQMNKETSPTKRAQMVDWYKQETKKPLGENILLWPDLQPYGFVTPDEFKMETTPYLDPTKNALMTDTWTMPNLTGAADKTMFDYSTNDDAKNAIDGGANNFNQIIDKYKQQNPNATTQQLHDIILHSSDGGAFMALYDKANNLLTFQNAQQAKRGGQPVPGIDEAPVPLLDFTKGIKTYDYALMQSAGRAKGPSVEATPVDPDYGLKLKQLGVAQFNAQTGRGELNQRIREWKAAREDAANVDKVDPEEKVRRFSNMQLSQSKYGTLLPIDDELKNIFQQKIPKVTISQTATTGDKKKGEQTTSKTTSADFTENQLKSVVVKGDGKDINHTTYEVTYADPEGGPDIKATFTGQDVWDLTDNMYGNPKGDNKFLINMQTASRGLERKLGKRYPTMEDLLPNSQDKFDAILKGYGRPEGEAGVMGKTPATPVTQSGVPNLFSEPGSSYSNPYQDVPRTNGVPDESKMVPGKYYVVNGTVIYYQPKKKK